jgi:HK97 family phage prohead protease
MTDAERRFTAVRVEIRAGAKDQMTIGGYAAKFNRMSQNLGGFVESIADQFFNGSRGDGWPGVVARYNHDDMSLLGTSDAGTLRMTLDTVGLIYDVDLPQARSDVFELVGRGDVRQSSFAFICLEDDWGTTDQGFPMRTLRAGRLIDVAPVNTPAYVDTSVGLRSLAAKVEAPLAEVERRAAAGDLISFLNRTDRPSPPRRSPHLALGKVLKLNADERL